MGRSSERGRGAGGGAGDGGAAAGASAGAARGREPAGHRRRARGGGPRRGPARRPSPRSARPGRRAAVRRGSAGARPAGRVAAGAARPRRAAARPRRRVRGAGAARSGAARSGRPGAAPRPGVPAVAGGACPAAGASGARRAAGASGARRAAGASGRGGPAGGFGRAAGSGRLGSAAARRRAKPARPGPARGGTRPGGRRRPDGRAGSARRGGRRARPGRPAACAAPAAPARKVAAHRPGRGRSARGAYIRRSPGKRCPPTGTHSSVCARTHGGSGPQPGPCAHGGGVGSPQPRRASRGRGASHVDGGRPRPPSRGRGRVRRSSGVSQGGGARRAVVGRAPAEVDREARRRRSRRPARRGGRVRARGRRRYRAVAPRRGSRVPRPRGVADDGSRRSLTRGPSLRSAARRRAPTNPTVRSLRSLTEVTSSENVSPGGHRDRIVSSGPMRRGSRMEGNGVSPLAASVPRDPSAYVAFHIRTFAALSVAGFRRYATYRQATVAGSVHQCRVRIPQDATCCSRSSRAPAASTVAGYSREQLVTFVWAGQGILTVVWLWAWTDLADRIRTGDVVTDLLRPVDPVTSYLAADLGRAGHALLTRMIPPMVVGPLFFPAYLPQRWQTVPAVPALGGPRDAHLLRVPLPGQRERLLAARHPRTADPLDGRVRRPGRALLPGAVLPRLARGRDVGADAVPQPVPDAAGRARRARRGRRSRPGWSGSRRSGRPACCSPAGWSSAGPSASWWCRVAEAGAARALLGAVPRARPRPDVVPALVHRRPADQRERDRAGRVHGPGALHGHPHHRRLRPALGAGRQLPHRVRVRARRPAGGQHRADQDVRPHRAASTPSWSARSARCRSCCSWTCRSRKMSRGLFGLGVLRRRAGPGRHRTGRRPGSRWPCVAPLGGDRCSSAPSSWAPPRSRSGGPSPARSATRSRTAGGTSRRTRSMSTVDGSGTSSRTASASRSSPTTRRWRCSAAPTRSACRAGWAGRARWSRCRARRRRPRLARSASGNYRSTGS